MPARQAALPAALGPNFQAAIQCLRQRMPCKAAKRLLSSPPRPFAPAAACLKCMPCPTACSLLIIGISFQPLTHRLGCVPCLTGSLSLVQALQIFGTNFQLVTQRLNSRMKLRGWTGRERERREVKRKFTREEKENPSKVDRALTGQVG